MVEKESGKMQSGEMLSGKMQSGKKNHSGEITVRGNKRFLINQFAIIFFINDIAFVALAVFQSKTNSALDNTIGELKQQAAAAILDQEISHQNLTAYALASVP